MVVGCYEGAPREKNLQCVNVTKNSFVCLNNVNLLHFVPLNPPLGQMCYKGAHVGRCLALPSSSPFFFIFTSFRCCYRLSLRAREANVGLLSALFATTVRE